MTGTNELTKEKMKQKRVTFSSSLDPEVKKQFKIFCVLKDVDQNDLIEDFLVRLFADGGEMLNSFKNANVPKVKRVTFTTSLLPELKRQFTIYCAVNGINQNAILENFMKDILANKEDGVGDGNSN